jgi:hypothetical protein
LDGLKDQPRSGRPPTDVPKDVMVKIRQELTDSKTGWDFFRQVMDLIYKKISGVRYHGVNFPAPKNLKNISFISIILYVRIN